MEQNTVFFFLLYCVESVRKEISSLIFYNIL